MKTMIGELYHKNNDELAARIYEDENERMFANGLYIGSTLRELMDYCTEHELTYQFDFGGELYDDEPELDEYTITLGNALIRDMALYGC